MSARIAGKKGTPEKVVELLKSEVARTSQAATARATGLTLKGVQNYLKGIGDPTSSTLEKLADYFKVSVAELRGENELIKVTFNKDEMISAFKNVAVEISTPAETIKQIGIAVVLLLQLDPSDQQIIDEVRGLAKQFSIKKVERIKGRSDAGSLYDKLKIDPQEVLAKIKTLGYEVKE